MSVADVAAEWIAGQVQIKPSTLSGYRYTLDRHILPTWGSRRLVEIGHGEVQAWITTLADGLAPSTVRQIYFALAALMKYSVKDGRINRDPTDGVQMPRKRATDRGYLSHDQVATLAHECAGQADLIALLAYTGLRWGEVVALKVSSTDFTRRRIGRPRGAHRRARNSGSGDAEDARAPLGAVPGVPRIATARASGGEAP